MRFYHESVVEKWIVEFFIDKFRRMSSARVILSILSLAFAAILNAAPTVISIDPCLYNPNYPDSAWQESTRTLCAMAKADTNLILRSWSGLSLPGAGARTAMMMALAGKTAPDILFSHFHIIRNDINQGFLYPLNEWIGEDLNGNGQIDLDEAKWDGWKNIPALWRQVATVKGKVYGLPIIHDDITAIIYRTDLVQLAGLDASRPPQTWDEFIYWCQKLTDPSKKIPGATFQQGQRGFAIWPSGYTWLPWLESAGGHPVLQIRVSPTTGKAYEFPAEATSFLTSDGENLEKVEPKWRADFASEAGMAAAEFYYRLRWMKWMIDPETREPLNLSEEDIASGFVMAGKRKIPVDSEEVISGVARGSTGQQGTGVFEMFQRGEVAMVQWTVQDLSLAGKSLGIASDLLGWFPFPAGNGREGTRVVNLFNHYAGMCENVKSRPKSDRDQIWRVLNVIADKRLKDQAIRYQVLSGNARFIDPNELKRLGFDEYLRDIPAGIAENFKELRDGKIKAYTEPFMGFWITMDGCLDREVISLIIAETGEDFDYRSALQEVERKANTGVMFGFPPELLERYRGWARIIFAVLLAIMAVFMVFIVRSFLVKREATSKQVYRSWLPWALLAPALILIGVWSYYPLMRGMVMAFQDYKIVGGGKFVGLDNFIAMALDPSFWGSLGRTVYFVFLNMVFTFLAPIILAVLLTEVPRGKVVYRTLFFLPQVSSGLVIALLWKLMYDPTPNGFLNQLIALLNKLPFVDIDPQTWLLNPKLAMICCVIPTVWASMGMASLIYIAALKGVPDDIYEAADMDGAGMRHKLRHIALPTLLPLIIINFVGAFIATFQNMGNIFLLTFGGPGEATMVIGMRIWLEAYNYLRFSMATSMAWVLGTMLIGFTYLQIQILRKVEFKKAEWK